MVNLGIGDSLTADSKRRSPMKKLLSMLAFLSACMALTFAQGSKESAASATAPEETKKARRLTLMINDGAGIMEGIQAEIDAFEKKSGITCEVEVVPSGDSGDQFTKVRLATGGMADLFLVLPGSKMLELNPPENMMDLTGRPFIDNVNSAFVEAATFDGKVYGVPAVPCSSAGGVFYNKKIYKRLGLEVPTTWNEFMANCEKVKATGIYPVSNPNAKTSGKQLTFLINYFYVNASDSDFPAKYASHHVDLHDNPNFLKGLEKMYGFKVKGYLDPDSEVNVHDDAARALEEGKAAHTVHYTDFVKYLANVVPEAIGDIGFFPLPDDNPNVRGVTMWLPISFVVNKNAKNVDEAMEFLNFIASPEAVEAYGSASQFTGPLIIKGASLPDNIPEVLKEAQAWTVKSSAPAMEFRCAIKGSNQATVCGMVAAGTMTPEDGLAEIEKDNAIDARDKGLWK